MDEDVSLSAVRDDKAIAFGGVEPFDPPGDFDEPNRAFIALRTTRRRFRRLYKFIAQFGPHSTRRLHILAAHEPLARRDWDHPLGSAKAAEIRNASDSVTKIANRSALNTGNTRSLSVAVDTEQKKSRRANKADGIPLRDATAPQRKA